MYRGHVKYTVPDSKQAEVREMDVEWPVKVVAVIQKQGFTLIKFEGFPDDLAWYEPGNNPEDHYILQTGEAVYKFGSSEGSKLWAVAETANSAQRLESSINQEKLWFKLPLRSGARYCPPGSRQPPMYCWSVERTQPVQYRVPGSRGKSQTGYTLVYGSLPDSVTYTVASGIGVLYYRYTHHGTVAEAEVRLKQIQLPPE